MKTGWVKISALIATGICSAAAVLWLADHRQALAGSGYIIAGLMSAFLVSLAWAFLLYLNLKDRARATSSAMQASGSDETQSASLYTLRPGARYQVRQAFADHYGNRFAEGERLTFRERHFLPHDGGHTLIFEEKAIFLQEDQSRHIIDAFTLYIVPTE